MALYGRDYAVGQKFNSPGRTITETDVVLFASLTGDNNELHTDAALMARSEFGARIAHGTLVAAVAIGMMNRMQLTDAKTSIAALQTSWKFVGPTMLGDTVYCGVTVTDVKRSKSKPERCVITYSLVAVNQNGAKCVEGELSAMNWWEPRQC